MNYEQIRAMIIQHEDICLTHEHNEADYKDKKQSREELIAHVLSLQERNEELLEAAQARVPLSDEDILEIASDIDRSDDHESHIDELAFARAIESAHGITN